MLPDRFLLALIGVLLGIVALMGYRLSRTPTPNASASVQHSLPTPLASLWQPFLPPNHPPLIVYSNPLFLLDDYWGLHGFSPANIHSLPIGARVTDLSGLGPPSPLLPRAVNFYYYDLYTGTGEVVAAANIARFLTDEKQAFSIERSGLVSFDLSRDTNVIFLGGPGANSHLANLSLQGDLDFASSGQSFQVIQDRHPRAGMASTYPLIRNPETSQIMTDYALISLLPAAVPEHFRLVLAGITTLGTQAAAEFATSPSQMDLLEKMRGGSGGQARRSRYFQSLLELQIRGGAITGIKSLLVRELQFK
jgi:hypothetical protein